MKEKPRNVLAVSRKRTLLFFLCLPWLSIVMGRAADGGGQAPETTAEERIAGIYDLVSSPGGSLPDWEKVRECFLKEAIVVLRTSRTAMSVFSLDGFLQDFRDFFERPYKTPEGTVLPKDKGFRERVLRLRSWEYGDIAQVLVLYEARILGISRPPQQGIDSWHLVRRNARWYVSSITNELVAPGRTLPPELLSDLPAVVQGSSQRP